MAAPGWYRDPGSDRLARWFDGQEWTHHTVVMADWRGRGSPPAPEDRTIVQSSGDAYVPPGDGAWAAPAGYEDFGPDEGFEQWDDVDDADDYLVAGRGGGYHPPTLLDRYREGPTWFRAGAPALLVLILLVAVMAVAGRGGEDDGDGGDVEAGADGERSLDEVIDIAYEAGFPEDIGEARVGSLIKLACEQIDEPDGVEAVAAQVARFDFDGDELSGATDGLREGAEAYCPEAVDEEPTFFRDVALAVSSDTARSSTTTSTTRAEGATSTSTTQRSTTTTKKPTPPTTRKPTPTSTSTSTTTSSTTSTTEVTPTSATSTTIVEGDTDGGLI